MGQIRYRDHHQGFASSQRVATPPNYIPLHSLQAHAHTLTTLFRETLREKAFRVKS